MSATTTLAPSAAAARATARPIPPPAPVMATTLPFRNSLIAHCLSVSSSLVDPSVIGRGRRSLASGPDLRRLHREPALRVGAGASGGG